MREESHLLLAIAAAYAALPSGLTGDRDAESSYLALRRGVIEQYSAVPVRIERWGREGQPYASSREMFADIERNGRLFVFTGGEDHPFLTRDENVMFRAVHDYYGHYLGRFQFGPTGEVKAWKAHCRMFSKEAIPAVTVELLGQNCWFNFGPFRHLRPHERPFAEQKASLLPEELWRPLLAESLRQVTPPDRGVLTMMPETRAPHPLSAHSDHSGNRRLCSGRSPEEEVQQERSWEEIYEELIELARQPNSRGTTARAAHCPADGMLRSPGAAANISARHARTTFHRLLKKAKALARKRGAI